MRRIFDYNFDLLDVSFIEPMSLDKKPVDEPLFADIDGDSGNNTLVGTSGNDTINGFGGNDTLDGLGGTNSLTGGTGIDTFIVSARGGHTTTITDFEDGVEVVDLSGMGVSSFDQLEVYLSQDSADVLLQTGFGFSTERLIFSNMVLADVSAADFIFDTVTNGVTITGPSGGSSLFGSLGDDIITGGSGSDGVNGGDGNDLLSGGSSGTNTLRGGNGTDTFIIYDRGSYTTTIADFEDGVEVVDLSGMGVSSFDQLVPYLTEDDGDVLLQTGNGFSTERLIFSNMVLADLSAADFIFDTVTNGVTITGPSGGSTLFGSLGDDVITGGSGSDDIEGGDGNDLLSGGSSGTNTLRGGNGTDTFIIYERGSYTTTIADFEDSVEVVDLSGMGVSSFDQLVPYLTEDDGDVLLQTGNGFSTERLIFSNMVLADLSAADFVFDTVTNGITITGPSGGSTLFGSLGDDVITGGSGFDDIEGGDGDDVLSGGSGNDVLRGGNGNDILVSGTGNDTNDGGAGTDLLTYIDSTSAVNVNLGAGTASGGHAAGDTNLNIENLDGSTFNDTLAGNDLDNIINGGLGSDRLIGGLGADVLNGGDGFDTVDYRGAVTAIRFNVDTGGTLGEALGDSFSGIERYFLSNFNDVITGSDANEFFYGEDGNDTINAGGGIDRVYGGDGNDIQRGQDGNDQLYGSAGNDQLNGGAGFDIANYGDALAPVIVNMLTGGTGGDANGDSYFGIEAVYGSDFDDSLTGNNSANELRGGEGDDALFGLGGNDRFFGGEGADSFDGGTGIDILNYTVATAGVALSLVTGGTSGEASGDTFTSIEWVFGSDFDDNITGDAGNNRIEGRDGDDVLAGGAGNDRLLGGDGNDIITGGNGVDTIFGQAGDDVMTGGAGNDFFFGGEGSDSHFGATGIDTVSYLASSSGVTLNMETGGSSGDAAGDSYNSIERIFGSGHDDSLTGGNGDDTILGNGGADYLAGGAGNDSLNGGAGVDSFGYDTSSDAGDVISGFTTNEVIYLLGGDPAFDTWAEVMAVGSDAAANVIFNFGGGNTLTIVGKNLADLDASNFDFSGTPPAGEPLSDPDAFAGDVIDVFDMDALI